MLLSPYQSNWYFRARFCTWNGQPCHKVASLSLFIIPLICGTCIKESPRPLPLNAGLTVLTYFLRFFPEPSTHSVVAYERVGCKVTCQATGPLIALFCFSFRVWSPIQIHTTVPLIWIISTIIDTITDIPLENTVSIVALVFPTAAVRRWGPGYCRNGWRSCIYKKRLEDTRNELTNWSSAKNVDKPQAVLAISFPIYLI